MKDSKIGHDEAGTFWHIHFYMFQLADDVFMMRSNEQLWWDVVSGALQTAKKIKDALNLGRPVVLYSNHDIPWRDTLINGICDFLSSAGYNCADRILPPESTPESLIQDQNAKDRYRPQNHGKNLQGFLREYNQLKERLYWIQRPKNTKVWLDFLRNWKPGSPDDGLFIVETEYTQAMPKLKSTIETVDYSRIVDSYDIAIFSGIIFSEIAEEEGRPITVDGKRYAATLAAELCSGNAQIAADFTARYNLQTDPIETLYLVCDFDIGSAEGLKRKLWTAQTRTLFPILEIKRVELIEKYRAKLEAALEQYRQKGKPIQQRDPNDTRLKIEVEDVDMLELNTIAKMGYAAGIPEYENIDTLAECRNLLSHLNTINPQDVAFLLSMGN